MNNILNDMLQLFQNEKIIEIFTNSDGGQGLLHSEIERKLSFIDIFELVQMTTSENYQNFLSKYKNYPNTINFMLSLRDKVNQLENFYQDSGTNEHIVKVVKNNYKAIIQKFPENDPQKSLFSLLNYIKISTKRYPLILFTKLKIFLKILYLGCSSF